MKPLKELRDGDVFWCIKPDEESEGYGDNAPRHPWKGKLVWHNPQLRIPPTYRLSRFSEATGEIDDDPNATAFILKPEKELFETFEEARAAYIEASLPYLAKLADDLSDRIIDLQRFVIAIPRN